VTPNAGSPYNAVPLEPVRLSLLERAIVPALLVVGLLLVPRGEADEAVERADLARARAFEARLQEVIARVSSSVITVSVEGDARLPGRIRSGGSGVIVDPAGYAVTNEHVTEGRDVVRVGLPDGRTVEGVVIGRDLDGDVAMLRLPVDDLPAARLGASEDLVAGDPVVALGNPFGLADASHRPAATLGIVSAVNRYLGGSKIYGDALQIDAEVNPGNSGGPLFDLEGRLVGINGRISIRGAARHNVGVGYAIPIHQIELILEELKAGRDVRRGYLGVRFFVHSDGRPGVVVRDVVPGSPAHGAGLVVGDRILAARGRRLDHPVRLQNYLSVIPAGRTVRLTILRDGVERDLEVTLGRRPGR